MKKFIKRSIQLFACWFIIHSAIICISGLRENYNAGDAILILGTTVHENGEMSDRLKSRVDKGLELYKDGYASSIVVSGGVGKEGHSEPRVMKNYLVSKGVDSMNVFIDNDGLNTHLSAINFKELSNTHKWDTVIIVSQYFHLTRARAAFQRAGIEYAYIANSEYFELRDLYGIFREFFGYYWYLVKY